MGSVGEKMQYSYFTGRETESPLSLQPCWEGGGGRAALPYSSWDHCGLSFSQLLLLSQILGLEEEGRSSLDGQRSGIPEITGATQACFLYEGHQRCHSLTVNPSPTLSGHLPEHGSHGALWPRLFPGELNLWTGDPSQDWGPESDLGFLSLRFPSLGMPPSSDSSESLDAGHCLHPWGV